MYEEVVKKFNENGIIEFKLYGMKHTIKYVNDIVELSLNNCQRKDYYNTLDEAFNNYTIYKEKLIDILDKIEIVG